MIILRIIVFIALILIVTFSPNCVSIKPIYFEDDKRIAIKKIESFQNLFNEQKYDEIYTFFSSAARNRQSKDQFITSLQKLHDDVGIVINSRLLKSEIRAEASFRLVHMFYETEFRKGKRFEEFVCLVDDEKVLIDFYGQPDMIPN